MEGSEDSRDENAAPAAAAAIGSEDKKVPSTKTSPSNTQDNLSQSAGSRLSAGSRNSRASRLSGEPKAPSGGAAEKTEEEEEEDSKDVTEKEEEAKLVPKSKSKDSVKREEIEMNDHAVVPPVAAATPLPTSASGAEGPATETHDVEVGKQNGAAHPEKVDAAGKKTLVQLMKKKEMVICFIGGVTFLVGLIMIIVGLMVMQSKCDRQLMGGDLSSNGHQFHHNGHASDQGPEVSHNRHHHQQHQDHHSVEVPYVLHGSNRSEESHHHGNLAKDKAASQSSTWLSIDGSPLNASLAVDGIHSNKANKGHCAQTESQSRPYWFVDLETMHHVKRVKVVIPGDCCIGELHDFEVRVGPNEAFELNTLCKHFMGTALKVSINIECDMDVYGRYVSIQMLGDDARPRDRLTLCEVMVYSK